MCVCVCVCVCGLRVPYLLQWALNDTVNHHFKEKSKKKVPWAVEYQNDGLSWISSRLRRRARLRRRRGRAAARRDGTPVRFRGHRLRRRRRAGRGSCARVRAGRARQAFLSRTHLPLVLARCARDASLRRKRFLDVSQLHARRTPRLLQSCLPSAV